MSKSQQSYQYLKCLSLCCYQLLIWQSRYALAGNDGNSVFKLKRERDRDRDRETETETERETERDRERQRETERQTDRKRQTERETEAEAERSDFAVGFFFLPFSIKTQTLVDRRLESNVPFLFTALKL